MIAQTLRDSKVEKSSHHPTGFAGLPVSLGGVFREGSASPQCHLVSLLMMGTSPSQCERERAAGGSEPSRRGVEDAGR